MGRLFKSYDNKITSEYGMRLLDGARSMHNGIDLVGKGNNNVSCLDYIVAHSDGVVDMAVTNVTGFSRTDSYGNFVLIRHNDTYSTLYAHMKHGSVVVKAGDKVKKGQVIGFMGDTGYSYGAHLHFEVRKNGSRIDPTPYINADLPKVANKPAASSSTSGSGFVEGDEIELTTRTYYNGATIPAWVFNTKLYYRGTNANGIVFSTQKTGAVTGTVKADAVKKKGAAAAAPTVTTTPVAKPAPAPTPAPAVKTFKEGDVIKLKPGSKYYNGTAIPAWVFNMTLYYRGTNANGVIFSTQKTGAITGVIKKSSIEGM